MLPTPVFACTFATRSLYSSCESTCCSIPYISECNENLKLLPLVGTTCCYKVGNRLYQYQDFMIDVFAGCVMGYASNETGYLPLPLYNVWPLSGCFCVYDIHWSQTPSYEGQVCKLRSGMDCGWLRDLGIELPPGINLVQGKSKEGRWDPDSGYCVVCQDRKEVERFDCSGDYAGDYKCDLACDASSECDEKYPYSSLPDVCGEKQLNVSRYCNGYCQVSSTTYTCDSSHACEVRSCGGRTYYCVYDWSQVNNPQWKWVLPPLNNEDGNHWQECFDGVDNDCDGYTDCADYECKGVQNPNTGTICCQSDSDCPGYDPTTHTKLVCECPDSSKCNIIGSSYTCKPKPSCLLNSDCDSGWCCYSRDYGGSGTCEQKGKIISYGGKSYICDPPEGFVSSSNENIKTTDQVNKRLTLLDLLIHPFFYFLKR